MSLEEIFEIRGLAYRVATGLGKNQYEELGLDISGFCDLIYDFKRGKLEIFLNVYSWEEEMDVCIYYSEKMVFESSGTHYSFKGERKGDIDIEGNLLSITVEGTKNDYIDRENMSLWLKELNDLEEEYFFSKEGEREMERIAWERYLHSPEGRFDREGIVIGIPPSISELREMPLFEFMLDNNKIGELVKHPFFKERVRRLEGFPK